MMVMFFSITAQVTFLNKGQFVYAWQYACFELKSYFRAHWNVKYHPFLLER